MSHKTNSYLSFSIGNEIYGAHVSHVIHISEMTRITKVPKAPEYMRGVLNLRGSVLPVLDARIKFGNKNILDTTNTCILVLEVSARNESFRLGVIVDSVKEVIEIDPEEIKPAPAVGNEYMADIITGIVFKNEHFILMLDVLKLFADESMIERRYTEAEAEKI